MNGNLDSKVTTGEVVFGLPNMKPGEVPGQNEVLVDVLMQEWRFTANRMKRTMHTPGEAYRIVVESQSNTAPLE